ncbi:MAG: VOC family protein [Actinomycetota bacterium]|jgi:catechol 2,3-dioxygenase|nr:VOC family protein [Actinomycetota bacterium]MDA8077287.1 VOC family protein [Actinomycetota bacterium]
MSIVKLGHAEVKVTDLDRSLRYYSEIMGLDVTEEASGHAFLHAADAHHEITLTQAERPGLEHYSWRVGSPEDLQHYAAVLVEHGFETNWFEGEPGQDVGLRFVDPSGMTTELYWHMDPATGHGSRRGISPERISHIVIATSAIEEFIALYRDVLGFSVSDYIKAPGGGSVGCFMRCNPDHHSLAVLHAPVPGALHHIAWYVPSFDGLKDAADVLADTGNEIEFGPGRHGIGANTYLYFRDPDRMRLEATGEMMFIPDTDYEPCIWKAEEFGKALSAWGQVPPESFRTEAV